MANASSDIVNMKSCKLYMVSRAFSLSLENSSRLRSRSPRETYVWILILATRTSSCLSWISLVVVSFGTASSHSSSSDTSSLAFLTIEGGPLATTSSFSTYARRSYKEASRVLISSSRCSFCLSLLVSDFSFKADWYLEAAPRGL
ncbi:hypothetical protein OGAPHI_004066 [Ogataea philodendri]|uniref:Uncharacterized protein n=1 Tax=Ogataea philodendri TaxID=1378263 RepID=A0A9P8P6V4_9ASCO|nr:uncharacterized protein OGAPHI_004066 [Ogataea philodendri]KAH3665877.1 hypothetical protein OGAPHI_004066 [Ogataea philodendri]